MVEHTLSFYDWGTLYTFSSNFCLERVSIMTLYGKGQGSQDPIGMGVTIT